MEGFIPVVREASVKTAAAARELVEAAERLNAEIARNEPLVVGLGQKVDQLRAAEIRLQELTDEIARKRHDLDEARAKYDAFMASLPQRG